MGILYTSVQLQKKMQRNMILERLQILGIANTQEGISIHDLDYDELKYELIIAEIRQVDIEHPEHRWFR